jgi:signal transduction histidine kinase
MLDIFINKIKAIVGLGVTEKLTTLEQGLIKLTNKAALSIILVVGLVFMPIRVLSSHYTIPILFLFAILFTFTLALNYWQKYVLARHYLIGMLYAMLLVISVFRGIESGILFVVIPMMLLSYIFFYPSKILYFHLVLTLLFTSFILWYAHQTEPILPHSRQILSKIYAVYLLISLSLTAVYINFVFNLHRRYQEELVSLNQTKNKLLSIIGHDLRSPLNSLKGLLNLIQHRNLSQEEFNRFTAQLSNNTESLSYTLDNLLQWAVSQMKGFSPAPVNFELRELSEQEYSLLAEAAKQKKLTIENKIPAEYSAHADVNHIGLVIRNLLNNAIKFTPQGGRITLEAEQQQEEIVVRIRDTGPGIDEALVSQLFGSQKHEINRGKDKESGTGLGLMLCREMVGYNKGRIWVWSKKDRGSTFSFTLPLPGLTKMPDTIPRPMPN